MGIVVLSFKRLVMSCLPNDFPHLLRPLPRQMIKSTPISLLRDRYTRSLFPLGGSSYHSSGIKLEYYNTQRATLLHWELRVTHEWQHGAFLLQLQLKIIDHSIDSVFVFLQSISMDLELEFDALSTSLCVSLDKAHKMEYLFKY